MASLSVCPMDGEVIRRLKIRTQRDGLSVERPCVASWPTPWSMSSRRAR